MAGPYLPILAVNRSQSLRIGNAQGGVIGNRVPQELGTDIMASGVQSVPLYIDISVAENRRDLQRHSAIGSYIIVGGLTNSNVDEVVSSGGVVSAGTGLTVNVTAGELKVRSTGVYVTGAAATNFALTAADGTQDRTDLIWWDGAAGTVGKTNGTLAAAGQSVAPATPAGKVPLAKVLVAATVTVPGAITDVRPRA